MVQHPEVLWAQRSSESEAQNNIIYLTVNLPDIQPPTLEYKLTQTSISFKAKVGDVTKNIPEKEFAFDLDLFADVVPEEAGAKSDGLQESTSKLTTRSFTAVIRKKEAQAEYWPRLTKEKVRNAFLKTDFSKWVDEDEQSGAVEVPEEEEGGMPGMGGMGGMPGMGGMGGMGGFGGGAGGMDINQMMAQMGAGGFDPSAFGGGTGDLSGNDNDEDDSDDDGPPPLEDAEPPK
ncbi:HSP20-like chaperone [Coprinopsis marcescibilis]|uniref:HSP20-like chaperone n=1 Tax=Coprinopsis marcescibilis TaxID=230819 RepID=A0A5C3LD35_COPMA|nr:HSP20-like chaperone [Coprinopsis marcescibilis]